MLLSSSPYFAFLIVVFFVYWPAARFRAARLAIILFANYFFYARWEITYLLLIPAASTCDYLIGLVIDSSKHALLRRLLVTLSLLLNIGLIASLKYNAWHWAPALGLSFYAFQSLTYTLDIYRRDAKATSSYLAHLTSVSFFPTILAGPITRVATLLPQWEKKDPRLDPADGGRGLFLIGMGLVKKLLIADFLAENLVNRVFDLPRLYSGGEVLAGVYGYAIQLYYDFSGYSDIAIGSALLLGIPLPANFNRPYAAENITDFWRRWHITFSNWLRDYLFFSLPGARTRWIYASLIITMTIGGLWHGVSWNFGIWGLLHGSALALTRAMRALRNNAPPSPRLWARALRILVTFHFVMFTWIFFRAASLDTARDILVQIASLNVSFANVTPAFAAVLAFAALIHFAPRNWYDRGVRLYCDSPFYVQAAALALLVAGIHYAAGSSSAPFIYTRF